MVFAETEKTGAGTGDGAEAGVLLWKSCLLQDMTSRQVDVQERTGEVRAFRSMRREPRA